MKQLTCIILLLAGLTFNSCASAQNKTETNTHTYVVKGTEADDWKASSRTLQVKKVTDILANIPLHVYYTQGSQTSIRLEGPKNILDRIKVEDTDGRLSLNYDKTVTQGAIIRCYLTCPQLQKVVGNSVCNFDATGAVRFDQFSYVGSGVCNIKFADLSCPDFSLTINGVCNSTIHLKDGKQVNISNNGVGNITATLQSKVVKVSNNGTGNIRLTVDCEQLKSSNNGNGKLTLSGTADDVDVRNTGMSTTNLSRLNK